MTLSQSIVRAKEFWVSVSTSILNKSSTPVKTKSLLSSLT
jgi:hypothetical protein